MAKHTAETVSARQCVVRALQPAAERFPDLSPGELQTDNLEPRDVRLAVAIHRTALQRWMTIEFLLDRYLHQPMRDLEPAMRAVLLCGGAQLLFMDRLPAHAVVDESVNLARKMVRQAAGGMVNAVLRKLARLISRTEHDEPWTAARDRLPLASGTVHLHEPCLPQPANLAEHLAIATSHPLPLIECWRNDFGPDTAASVCLHGIGLPPTIVAVEPEANLEGDENCQPHEQAGFVVWQGSHEMLVQFLSAHPTRRVQDPASAEPVAATAGVSAKCIIDYCAGRGTKSRQLAVTHPQARIIATDIDNARRTDLRTAMADIPAASVVAFGAIGQHRCDLLVLDVPCSNTAVLARRPEARYRYNKSGIDELVTMQRSIIESAIQQLDPGGHLLYATCSLAPAENQQQIAWMKSQWPLELISESQTLPGGVDSSHHDGSYHALLRLG